MILTISPSISISTEHLIDFGIPTDGFSEIRSVYPIQGIGELQRHPFFGGSQVGRQIPEFCKAIGAPVVAMAEASFNELCRRELVWQFADMTGN